MALWTERPHQPLSSSLLHIACSIYTLILLFALPSLRHFPPYPPPRFIQSYPAPPSHTTPQGRVAQSDSSCHHKRYHMGTKAADWNQQWTRTRWGTTRVWLLMATTDVHMYYNVTGERLYCTHPALVGLFVCFF